MDLYTFSQAIEKECSIILNQMKTGGMNIEQYQRCCGEIYGLQRAVIILDRTMNPL